MTPPPCHDRRHTRILLPVSAKNAAILAARHQAPYLAGASAAQLGWNKAGCWPKLAINLHPLDELRGCQQQGDHWSIGALTRLSSLTTQPLLRKALPALHESLTGVGAPGIRHIATLGGNIGFGGDLVPTLLVLDAQVDWLQGSGEQQRSTLAEWLLQPPEHALITHIRIPAPASGQRVFMEKLASREAFNPPRLNIASCWQWQALTAHRLAASGAGLAPRRLRHCEQALAGSERLLTTCDLQPLLARDLPELIDRPLLKVAANLLHAQWSKSRT